MVRQATPELKQFMDKKLRLELNANRVVIGILRGFDAFMNVSLEDARDITVEDKPAKLGRTVVRGTSI
ncbi:hypothetical protein H4R23_001816, partial [Coemansia sp. Cherry 401B]